MTPLKKEAVKQQLSYYGRPSGREILSARLGELIESYNKETEKENDILERTKKEVKGMAEEIIKVVLGSAAKTLLRSRDRESEMGNFVADAMLMGWQNKTMPDGSRVRLSLANSGGIRAPFEKGNITQADLLAAFPFQNTFDLVTIEGQYLR